jgi:CheY-like chemotaxis protein
VRLPLERGVEIEADEIVVAPRALSASRTLVCDANPLSQAVIKAALAAHVRALETSPSVEQAIEVAGNGRFDLILVDAVTLGQERQARLAALRDLAAAVSPAVVAVMIADIGEDEAGRLLGAGASQIIRKPIPASKLAGELHAGYEAREEAWVARRAISAA